MDINAIWEAIKPYFTAGTIATAIGTIIGVITKHNLVKKLEEIDFKKTEEEVVASGIKKVKEITYKCDITPIVESKLADIQQKALLAVREQVAVMQAQYANMLAVLKGIASYFDDSIAISEERKEELREVIANAESELPQVETIVAEVETEPEIVTVETKKVNVER